MSCPGAGIDSGISSSQVSRICAKLDVEVDAFRNRSLAHIEFPYVYLDATYEQGIAWGLDRPQPGPPGNPATGTSAMPPPPQPPRRRVRGRAGMTAPGGFVSSDLERNSPQIWKVVVLGPGTQM